LIRFVRASAGHVQTLERKQSFIQQVMSGEAAGRDVEDLGDVALSFAEIKASATGGSCRSSPGAGPRHHVTTSPHRRC
jgi:hypothetical protein